MRLPKKILLGTLAFLAFVWISNSSYEDAVQAENQYCEMVARFINSDGENGWPPYRSEINCQKSEEN